MCVVGLGSPFGDDRLGWWVVERLQASCEQRAAAAPRLVIASTPVAVLEAMPETSDLVIVDACQGLGSTGEIVRLRWPAKPITGLRHRIGHNLALDEVLGLAASLGQLPAVCEVWCVEGCQFQFNRPLSPEVEAAGARIAAELLCRIADRLR